MRRGSIALFLAMTHARGRAAIGCRPDAADVERDLLAPAESVVILVTRELRHF